MESFSRITLSFLLFTVLLTLQLDAQNVDQNQPEKPSLSKMVANTISLLKRSHASSWEKIKTVVHDMKRQFSPSILEGVGETETEVGIGGVKGTVKEAVATSFDKSKATVKESAADVVKEAVHNTAEKVTGEDSEPDAEL